MGPMRSPCLLAFTALVVVACSSEPHETTGSGGAGASGGSGGEGGAPLPPTGPITGAVTRYTYAFDLTTAHARAQIDVEVAAPGGDCFGVACGQPASAVTWNDAPASSAAVQDGSLAACGPGIAAGEPLRVAAEVDVPEQTFFGLDIGFSRKKDLDGGDFAYLLSWVGGCDRFGPCDDHPSRLSSFHFDVTHPSGTVVLCPGALTAGETLTQCDLQGTLAPTYSAFGFAASTLWKRSLFATAAGVDLVFYETPSGGLAKALEAPSVSSFMTWITGLLGPFPYGKELRFAGAPTAWLGFEHPGNVLLRDDLPSLALDYPNGTMHVLMHETVHQWAGDRTTLAETADFVWKEATAEYLSYVFEDEQRPPGEADASLEYWDSISLQAAHYPRPTEDPTPPVQTFYGDVYGPGPMVLFVQLESMLGREATLGGIKAFLAEPGARRVSDLRAALEQSSGQDLKPYFDTWVFGTGKPEWPTFAVSASQVGDQVTVTVTQQNASKKLYGCKVEIEVVGATQKVLAAVDFGLAPTSAVASATVTLAEPVASTVLDPRHRLVGRLAGGSAAPEPERPIWPL